MTETYLSRREAAAYLAEHGYPATNGTLAKLACIGGGPTYRKFGSRSLYTPGDLLSWAESRLSEPMASASERGTAA